MLKFYQKKMLLSWWDSLKALKDSYWALASELVYDFAVQVVSRRSRNAAPISLVDVKATDDGLKTITKVMKTYIKQVIEETRSDV